MDELVGIIGFGNMGSAIAEQIKSKYKVLVFDKDKNKTKNLKGINVAANLIALVKQAEIVILAVKPQDLDAVLKKIKTYLKAQLVISIAAGVSTRHIENYLSNAKVVRAMPNIGVKIGESVSALARGISVSDEDFSLAEELFYCLGVTKEIAEQMMNPATAISGSGPAYIYDDLESAGIDPFDISEQKKEDYVKRLTKAAEAVGFNSQEAMFFATNTTNASINLLKKTRILPAELKKQVASKAGTTEKALQALRKTGSWEEAAQAALRRARELSRKE